MEEVLLNYIYNNKKINSINDFGNIKGAINQNEKEIFFVRAIGTNNTYIEDIKKLDECSCKTDILYNRISKLPAITDRTEADFYAQCFENWIQNNKTMIETKFVKANMQLSKLLGKAGQSVLKIFKENKPSANPTIEKNFIVKCLYWFDNVLGNNVQKWNNDIYIKIVAENIIKEQEYLFFYMLTCIGADVLLLQYEKDVEFSDEVKKLSDGFLLGDMKQCSLPVFSVSESSNNKNDNRIKLRITDIDNRTDRIVVHIPERNSTSVKKSEKSFEELARLASSIVMICVHDEKDEVVGEWEHMLLSPTGISVDNVFGLADSLGGIAFPAHVDRDS